MNDYIRKIGQNQNIRLSSRSGSVADGDVFDQHGIRWWKTCARKLFTRDPTFEGSAVWSIDKMIRDGNLTALPDLARITAEALRLRDRGIDSQFLFEIRLQEIEQAHLDHHSQAAFCIARSLLVETEFTSEVDRLSDDAGIQLVAHELLARTVIENSCTPNLVHALSYESGRHRLSRERLRRDRVRGLRILRQADSVKQRASRQLQKSEMVGAKPATLSRPRANVDQRALLNEALGV